MIGKNLIVKIKLNDHTTFMSDEVVSILYDIDSEEREMVTVFLRGKKVSYYLDDIEMLQLYPKTVIN